MEKASARAENPSPVSETGLRFSANGLKNLYNHFVQPGLKRERKHARATIVFIFLLKFALVLGL